MAGMTAMPTPWFLPTATVNVDRNNKRADEQLIRVITELDLKKRKAVKKIEERIKYIKEELRSIFDNVDLSTDIHESPFRQTKSDFYSRNSFEDSQPKRCKTKTKNDDVETESRSRSVHFLPNINNTHGSNLNLTGDNYSYEMGNPANNYNSELCISRSSPDYDPVRVIDTKAEHQNEDVIAKVMTVNTPRAFKTNIKPIKKRNKHQKKRKRDQTKPTKLPFLSKKS